MRCALLLGLISISSVAHASDNNDRYFVRGAGAGSCTTFVQVEKGTVSDAAGTRQDMLSWAQGYLSSYNRLAENVYDIYGSTDIRGIESWLLSYCTGRPSENFTEALDALIVQLYPRRKVTAPQ
jgi:hypothetical protein